MRVIRRALSIILCAVMLLTTDTVTMFAQTVDIQTEDIQKEIINKGNVVLQTQDQEIENEALISHVVLGNATVDAPGTQSILVGIQGKAIENAILHIRNQQNGEMTDISQARECDEGHLFEINYTGDSDKGIYQVAGISFESDKREQHIDFADIGLGRVVFGVGEAVDTEPDAYVVEDGEEATGATDIENYFDRIVRFTEDGKEISEENIAKAIENARADITTDGEEATKASKTVVVVLDAGHGGTDGGAQGNGLSEKVLNLKIALACRDELNTYAGIKVYMTRTTDDYIALADRTMYAHNMGADLFVSIHNNSSTSSGSRGAMVFYPNQNYNATVGANGQKLAQQIQNQLVALGLGNNGIKIRNSESGDTYDDGSLCDYYAVIRASKKYGFPGIIVEHAFVSNAADATTYLNSDEKLKKLGIADATGIANYLGLHKKSSTVLVTPSLIKTKAKGTAGIELEWTGVAYADEYEIYRSNEKDGAYKRVRNMKAYICTWEDTDVDEGVTYYYKVRGKKVVDGETVYSEFSDIKTVKNLKRPTFNEARAISSTKVELNWNKRGSTTSYEIQRKEAGKSYKKIATVKGNSTFTYTDSELVAGTKYTYRIRSLCNNNGTTGYSDYSTTKSVTTLVKAKVTSVVCDASTEYAVFWNKEATATGYELQRKENGGSYSTIAKIKNNSTDHFTDAKAKSGKTYYYRVRIYVDKDKKVYYGSYSSAVKTNTLKAALKPAQATTSKKIVLKWNKTKDASGYMIYRSTSKNGTYSEVKTVTSGSTVTYTDATAAAGKTYYYKIRPYAKSSSAKSYGKLSGAIKAITLTPPAISVKASENKAIISWKEVKNATSYLVYRSDAIDGSYKQIGSTKDAKSLSYVDKTLGDDTCGYYKVKAVRTVDGITSYSTGSNAVSTNTGYRIMGNSTVTVAQMVSYYNASGKKYPANVYKDKGAKTIEEFCKIVYNEAKAEGVRAEVIWAQICLETGYLQFKGDVKAEQCNFGGLGAIGNGVCGETFVNVNTGVRAQVQHLKAYGSTDSLKQVCVDTRFGYVKRGTAVYVEWLGIQENPNGYGWAASKDYGNILVKNIRTMKNVKTK